MISKSHKPCGYRASNNYAPSGVARVAYNGVSLSLTTIAMKNLPLLLLAKVTPRYTNEYTTSTDCPGCMEKIMTLVLPRFIISPSMWNNGYSGFGGPPMTQGGSRYVVSIKA